MKPLLLSNIIGLAGVLTFNATAAVGTISGPFTYRNLQVFLVHGDTQLEQRHYSTLSEALAKKTVVVRETGNVQQLSIENLSKDTPVFLNAGDIVKGGRQDRTIRDDLILAPHSGPVPLGTFCVESGRWTRRGAEDAGAFSENSKVLTSRKLKMAARYGQNQGDVWAGVAEQQQQLNANVSTLTGKTVDARNATSASSLQLTLENKDLESITKQYLQHFNSLLDGKTDVIGFVYAINGELNSAEVYNNKSLFRALWPKLLEAAVTEAIAEYNAGRQVRAMQAAGVRTFFETAVSGSVTERTPWKTTLVKTYTTPTTVLFETIDVQTDGLWLHKSFVLQERRQVVVPLDRDSARQTQSINRPLDQ